MTTRLEMITKIRAISLVEADDFPDSDIISILDAGYLEVSREQKWDWLYATTTISTVASQQAYTLPANYSSHDALVVTAEKRRLYQVSRHEVLSLYGGDVPSATPDRYYVANGSVYLVPIPDASETDYLTLHYYTQPTLLTSTSSEPEWDEQFHDVLVDYALWKVLQREEQYDKAREHRDAYYFNLQQMEDFYAERGEHHPMVIGQPRSSFRSAQWVPYDWMWGP